MTQVHQSNLAAHLTPYDPGFRARLAGLTSGLGRYSVPPVARRQAYGALYGIQQQQSGVKAYVDMFCWAALIVALCLPGVWLLHRVAGKGSMTAH